MARKYNYFCLNGQISITRGVCSVIVLDSSEYELGTFDTKYKFTKIAIYSESELVTLKI